MAERMSLQSTREVNTIESIRVTVASILRRSSFHMALPGLEIDLTAEVRLKSIKQQNSCSGSIDITESCPFRRDLQVTQGTKTAINMLCWSLLQHETLWSLPQTLDWFHNALSDALRSRGFNKPSLEASQRDLSCWNLVESIQSHRAQD